jgi:5-methylthioadenosine/S-adenosylhomocysteine deaminase
MEAAHTLESVHASAQLGIAELIRGGTTCALTMETVNHTDGVFQAIAESGFRATSGKCMMDKGEGVPEPLLEETRASVAESLVLLDRWHGRAGGRIRYAFAPRFAVSCTRELLEQVAGLSAQRGVPVHSHASENTEEIELVERETGERNIVYLNDLGLTGPGVVLAHCVHVDNAELEILRRTRTHVAHCPSSNLKLASGFARVAEMLKLGISVSLGADGAACNNRLDMFTEMRTAALIQKALGGPETLPALTALRMATRAGAGALGLGDEIGSIEVGKRADLMVLDLKGVHTTPGPDLISTIVYSAGHADVETVVVDGQVVMRNRELTILNEQQVISRAKEQAELLADRASILRSLE